jgi:hypothetical protein
VTKVLLLFLGGVVTGVCWALNVALGTVIAVNVARWMGVAL